MVFLDFCTQSSAAERLVSKGSFHKSESFSYALITSVLTVSGLWIHPKKRKQSLLQDFGFGFLSNEVVCSCFGCLGHG